MRISRTPSPFLAWSAMLSIAAFGIGAATALAQVPVPGRGGVSLAGVVPLDRVIATSKISPTCRSPPSKITILFPGVRPVSVAALVLLGPSQRISTRCPTSTSPLAMADASMMRSRS